MKFFSLLILISSLLTHPVLISKSPPKKTATPRTPHALSITLGSPQRSVALINGPRVKAWNKHQMHLLDREFDKALITHDYNHAYEIGILLSRSGLHSQKARGKKWQNIAQEHQRV